MSSSAERLRQQLKRQPIDLSPANTYEVLTRAQLEDLEKKVTELQTRINILFFSIIAAIAIAAIERLVF